MCKLVELVELVVKLMLVLRLCEMNCNLLTNPTNPANNLALT